ncbi:MAG: ATP-dependent DNA helicase RecG [Gammaproteobacteria bacterium]
MSTGNGSATDPLQSPVATLKGVGPALAARLAVLGIETLEDLLFHLPIRYEDRTRVTPIGALRPLTTAQVEGEVQAADILFGRRRSLLVKIADRTGIVALRFYHFNATQKAQFARGTKVRAFGDLRRGASGLEFYHPEYRILHDAAALPLADRLTPVYGITEGVTQARIRALTDGALQHLQRHAPAELVPAALLERFRLPSLREALDFVHHPPPGTRTDTLTDGSHPAIRRLALEELSAHQLSMLAIRNEIRRHKAPALAACSPLEKKVRDALQFALTGAQERVLAEIAGDLAKPSPMLRLVQGDVGAGKTAVAALAAAQAIAAGAQVALMAPTEILAEQHLKNFSRWFTPLGVNVGWLTSRLKKKERDATAAALADGSLPLVIGTHALFQEEIAFAKLGLVIVDEQHRFGVQQRLALRDKGGSLGVPHQLIMTATPIPRTLAMSAYGDLDTSVIDELPPGRTPVQTVVLGDERRPDIIERIRKACAEKKQAYWVCPLIEESEEVEAQAAETTREELAAALPGIRIGLVHGRQKGAEKAATMNAFKAGDIDLLVATTVIEVGVDVPNASLMVIENAERLGLAQLHQLRGRVGRGAQQSFCVLLYKPPLSQLGRERLAVMRETTDGFRIAEKDLELRGPGEVLGTRQTGDVALRVADLARDASLVETGRELALELAKRHPERVPLLIRRWLGEAVRYSRV